MAKFLNSVIEPYILDRYSIKRTDELLDLLKVTQPIGILASLDVENVFTNVPIDETIKIILDSAYGHSNLPPPKLPRETLKKLLELCTKESPFKHIDGSTFKQKDCVAIWGAHLDVFSRTTICLLSKIMY